MKNPSLLKCALLALLGALPLIPLAMVERTIDERTAYRAEAIHAIAASTASLPPLGANPRLRWGTPTLSVGIADPRGLSGEPKIQLGGQLLTSLSEHIAFSMAYLAVATACIALIGIHVAAILRGWRRGLGFTFALATLYAALFGILRSEQSALLLGSVLLFFALAGVMLGTRRIDWYGLSTRTALANRPASV